MNTAKSLLLKHPAERRAVSAMGRLGYAARGVIYLIVGVSAGLATFLPHYRPGGAIESLRPLQHHWAGAALIVVLALGLACLAGWLAVAAILRRDHPGPAHLVLVIGTLGDAAVYVGFVVVVAGAAVGASHGGDPQLQSWVAWLLARTDGRVLVGGAGAAVFACGAGLFVWGLVGDVEGPLSLPPAERRLMQPVGRYGTSGRGAAIAAVGASLFAAALHGNPHEAHAIGGMLAALREHQWGVVVIGLFALAFIGSSALDFTIAGFRRFDPTDP